MHKPGHYIKAWGASYLLSLMRDLDLIFDIKPMCGPSLIYDLNCDPYAALSIMVFWNRKNL
jgi:hypothetical protein